MAKKIVTYLLKTPITLGSEIITELAFKEPTLGDLEEMPLSGQTMGDMVKAISSCTGQPPSVIKQIGLGDMTGLMEVVTSFLPDFRATGATL